MRKSLLLSMLITMMACFGVQAQSWQYELKLTSTDASARKVMGMYNQVTTPVYTLDEATSTIRLTVFSTENVDKNFPSGFSNNSSAFPTFAIGELRLFDGEGKQVELTADMITTNALSLNEGSIDALVDNDPNTHFHSTYSKGEVPQAYHYIEIALTDAMSKFQLQYDTRYYYFFTDPTHIGITGGTEALPWKDEEFVIGEQVTSVDALQPNKLYVIRGNYFEFTRTDDERTLPSYGEAYYHSPIGAALTPSSASLMWLEDAGEGKYFMHWLKYNRYIKKSGEIEAGAYVEATTNPLEAAALEFAECDTTDGAFIITSENNYLGQRRFVKMSWVNKDNMAGETSTYHYAWNIYEASTNMSSIQPMLEATIAKGENFMAIQGVASEDDGEYEALSSAIAEAKAAIAGGEATADELLAMDATLNEFINAYRITYIYVLSDSIDAIVSNDELFCGSEGWVNGCYPEGWIETLTDAMDKGGMVADNPVNSANVEATIDMMCNTLDLFYAAEVKNVAQFPIHIEDEADGLTASAQVNNSWVWTSPVYYLAEETDILRMTVFKNSSGETESGTPFFCLGELYLFTAEGDTIELREDMLTTNSIQDGDGGGLAAIVDKDHGSYYHGCYNPNETSFAPEQGVYAYIEIALDEPVNAFFFKTISRSNTSDYYKHTPLDYALTAGTTIAYNDLFPDLYPVTQGEQITDASQVQAGELYLLYGNLEVVTNGSEGSGYYNGAWQNVGTANPGSASIVTFEDAGDGKLYMRNISNNAYLKTPAGWEGASVTHITAEAAPLSIMNSTNLEKSFKIYYEGVITDPSETAAGGYGSEAIFVMQAWAGNIGMFTITDWDSDDKDGESDWYIYKASVENYDKLNLEGAIASIESYGIEYENAGEAVGMLKAAAIEPIAKAYAKAVAVLESGDAAAMQSATTELQAVIQTVPSVETVELISGNDYIIRSSNKEFKQFHGEDCKLSMFVGPADGSGADASAANMVYFNYEYSINGMDSSIFHWTFTQDTIVNEGEEAWAKYTIKNVYYNEYIVPAFPNGKNITTSPFSSNDAAPLIYMRPGSQKIGDWTLVGVDAWHQPSSPSYCYFETRTGGGPYTTSGAAHYGRVATWSYSANTTQWQIVPVAVATSINDIVVDEPAGEVISTSYITPDGVTSNVPVKGVCIIRRVYANGVITTEKEFIK